MALRESRRSDSRMGPKITSEDHAFRPQPAGLLLMRRCTRWAIIFCLIGFFPGCHPENPEQKGDAEAKSGRFESAIYWYESALGADDRSAIHWKMAEIFANKLRDPASAAYHYRRILALHAGGSRAEASRAALRRLEAGSAVAEGGQNRAKSGPTPKSVSAEQAAAEGKKPLRVRCAPMSCNPATVWSPFRRSSIRRLPAGKTFWTQTRTSCPIRTN